jgi:hypothetical protein
MLLAISMLVDQTSLQWLVICILWQEKSVIN